MKICTRISLDRIEEMNETNLDRFGLFYLIFEKSIFYRVTP